MDVVILLLSIIKDSFQKQNSFTSLAYDFSSIYQRVIRETNERTKICSWAMLASNKDDNFHKSEYITLTTSRLEMSTISLLFVDRFWTFFYGFATQNLIRKPFLMIRRVKIDGIVWGILNLSDSVEFLVVLFNYKYPSVCPSVCLSGLGANMIFSVTN